MNTYLITKATNKQVYVPVRVPHRGKLGMLVLTIDDRVLHIKDEEVTDVTSSYLISSRDN